MLEVQDTGIGIPAEALKNIFRRFYRVDPARQMDTGGSGLGLAKVKKVVENHKGYIQVQSELGAESLFRVRLPTL